MLLGAKQLLLT